MTHITYQSLFKLYPKLAGMTKTVKIEVKIYVVMTFHLSLCYYEFLMTIYIIAGEKVLKNVLDASH